MLRIRTWLITGVLLVALLTAGCLRRGDDGGIEAAQSRPLPSPTASEIVDELPPDELPPDELPPDELPPDELPPDELPPDELPPDELPPDETGDEIEPDDLDPLDESFVTEEPTLDLLAISPSDTPTPEDLIPVLTETPTPGLSVQDVSPTQVAQVVTITPTPDLLNLFPSETPTLTPSSDPVALTQVAQIITETPTPFEVAQEFVTDDQLTATAIIQAQTQIFIDMTLTAEEIFVIEPDTPTPEIFFTPTPEPILQPTSAVAFGECQHTVVRGDNLFRLSLRYGALIDDIAARNGISNPQLIVVGQQLVIPNCQLAGGGVGQPAPLPIPGNCVTAQGGRFQHVVRQGETLFQISLQYNVPIQDIANANCIFNINLIFYSQVLNIP